MGAEMKGETHAHARGDVHAHTRMHTHSKMSECRCVKQTSDMLRENERERELPCPTKKCV